MRFYHTSNVIVSKPDVSHSRKHLDFGMGFYLTSMEKQARDYGQRFIRRGEPAIMNVFEFAEETPDVNRKFFPAYDGKWLDYVAACRKDLPHEQYDVVEQALDQLRWKKPNHQLCIASQEVIDRYLQFIESITL